MRARLSLAPLALSVALAASCAEPERLVVRQGPLAATCTAQVVGIGPVDVESDYLPHVVACENGGAGPEALRAQAVAARTYLYFQMAENGEIEDGTGDQVYTCANQPTAAVYEAVEATSGLVLTWQDLVLAAFYVAGAKVEAPGCEAGPADEDPTNTERYVTYNEGRSDDAVLPSPLGHSANPHNRGCMSQWGARCLEDEGYDFRAILRFYYGDDVVLERADGACVVVPSEDLVTPPPEDVVVASDLAPADDVEGGSDSASVAPDLGPPADLAPAADTASPELPVPPDAAGCVPVCDGRTCGPDGCGGACGACEAGSVCTAEGLCALAPVPPDTLVGTGDAAGCAVGPSAPTALVLPLVVLVGLLVARRAPRWRAAGCALRGGSCTVTEPWDESATSGRRGASGGGADTRAPDGPGSRRRRSFALRPRSRRSSVPPSITTAREDRPSPGDA